MSTGYRKWSEVRGDRADLTPAGLAEARRKLLAERSAFALAEIRKQVGLTQTDVARVMGVSQNRVSVIERGDLAHTELDTVRSYVEALGGKVPFFAHHNLLTGAEGEGHWGWYSEEFEAKLDEAAGAPSLDESVALYQEAEAILAEEFPTIPFRWSFSATYYSERLDNVLLNPFSGAPMLRRLTITQ
jgi:transcriptional regulator with XRE-family HTH domain